MSLELCTLMPVDVGIYNQLDKTDKEQRSKHKALDEAGNAVFLTVKIPRLRPRRQI